MDINEAVNGLKQSAPIEPDVPPAVKKYDMPLPHKYHLQEKRHGDWYCIECDIYVSIKGYNEQQNQQ